MEAPAFEPVHAIHISEKNMKIRRSVLSLALSASLLGSVAWSPTAQACAVDAYISSVCIMAWPKSVNFGNGSYQAALGQTLTINQYQALFSLIGNTYGGSYPNTFQLPDLRGRVVIGAGQGAGLPAYNYGEKGGVAAVTLSLAQLPVHNHLLGSGVVTTTGIGTLAANTTIGSLAASTTIGTLAANTTLSGLTATLNAASGGASTSIANGAALLSVSPTTPPKIYTTGAVPSVALHASSIGISGSPTTTLTGSPTTTLTGAPTTTLAGGPAVTVTGQTNTAGASTPVTTMSPYLALMYYITINGIYPVQD